MSTLSTQVLAALLHNSGLVHSEEAIELLGSVPVDLRDRGAVPSEQLLATYSVRLEILHTRSGPYASELLDSTSELCGRLKEYAGPCCIVTINSGHPFMMALFISSDGTRALGCLKFHEAGVRNAV